MGTLSWFQTSGWAVIEAYMEPHFFSDVEAEPYLTQLHTDLIARNGGTDVP